MRVHHIICAALLLGCGSTGISNSTLSEPTSASEHLPDPRPAERGAAPADPPMEACATATDPLAAAVCRVGTEIADFPFECDAPRALTFCSLTEPNQVMWACVGDQPSFRAHPETATENVPAEGSVQPAISPTGGSITGVQIEQVATPGEVESVLLEWLGQARSWGCEREPNEAAHWNCGDTLRLEFEYSESTEVLTLTARIPEAAPCWAP